MPTVLDQRIDEWSARLADLRHRAAEIEREAGIIEIRLETFHEARLLIQGEDTPQAEHPKTPEVSSPPNGQAAFGGMGAPVRHSRLSPQWRNLLAFALTRYPATVTNNDFSAEADRLDSPIPRDNLRSALWTHTKNDLFEKIESGVYRITETGAAVIGAELPKSLEAESVERIPAPLSASHEPPLEGPVRQPDVHSAEEAAHKPVEPVLGGGT